MEHVPALRRSYTTPQTLRIFCDDPGVLAEYLGTVIHFARGSVRVSADEGRERFSVGDVERL